ncbi:ComF family protein [Fibrobacter sp. UWR2]|uniref:ComF family protein n=1 Tax=Fibrobacter sp. UWR2 TaxID=1964352 RepID=UPI000B528445|nr:ComF family protein [Fibrobacter sp. UWR2]OWV00685.1 amidophosphoribosyltransferase [Fibrobacter sp. UWR2]
MEFIRRCSGFLFGMECLGCGSVSERLDPWLCPACREELLRESREYSFPGPDAMSLFPMRPLTRRLIHALKYKGLSGMASYLVRHSSAVGEGGVAQSIALLARPYYFVPVPLHSSRYRERGYNQAQRIAAALATVTGGRVCNWLARREFRVSQTKLSREEREWNVAGAFERRLPRELPRRGTVFVVDDVFTTGATTSSCISAFGRDFPLDTKVCTLLYDEPVTATMDFVADCKMEWNV